MVPHLTAVLGTMLPMLGMAKQENMRWVFSSGKNLQLCFDIHLLKIKYQNILYSFFLKQLL